MLVNSDGTMAIYNTIENENIKSWTLANTTGSFIDVSCVANQAKVLTRRKVLTSGEAGQLDSDYTVDSTFTAFRDVTTSIVDADNTAVFTNDLEYFLVGSEIVFTNMAFNFHTPSMGAINATFEFLNDLGQWQAFVPTIDTTGSMAINGNIGWNQSAVSNWKAQTLPGTSPTYNELPTYYWLRMQRHNSASFITPVIHTLLINTANRIYMERLEVTGQPPVPFAPLPNNIPTVMDSQLYATADSNGLVTGLDSMVGQNVFVFGDQFPLKTYYVPLNGEITVDATNTIVRVGLDYKTNITPMPIIALLVNGVSVYEPAHVDFLYIDFYQSLGITCQGQPIPQTVPGLFMTQSIPVPVTDYYKQPQFGGWDPRVEFVISQSYPAPMTILAVSYTIEVSP